MAHQEDTSHDPVPTSQEIIDDLRARLSKAEADKRHLRLELKAEKEITGEPRLIAKPIYLHKPPPDAEPPTINLLMQRLLSIGVLQKASSPCKVQGCNATNLMWAICVTDKRFKLLNLDGTPHYHTCLELDSVYTEKRKHNNHNDRDLDQEKRLMKYDRSRRKGFFPEDPPNST